MKKDVVMQYFGGARKVAELFGISVQAVSQWPDPIPVRRELEIEKMIGRKKAKALRDGSKEDS